jgi:hypothetical protein
MIRVDCGASPRSDEVVLFPFDSASVPFRSCLQLKLIEATKLGYPVLECGQPGTPDCVTVRYYGTVIRIGEQLRLWYLGIGDQDNLMRICYAVSQDGINWQKPALGLARYHDRTDNNLVSLPYEQSIMAFVILHEPDGPDRARRFKMTYQDSTGAVHVAFSEDGLTWTNSGRNPVIMPLLELGGLIKFNGCYYVNGHGGGFRRRSLVTHASYDFENWTQAVAMGFRRDSFPPRPLIYGFNTGEQVHLGATVWNRGNVILGFYGMWHGAPVKNDDRRFVNMDIGLIVSTDAIHYREPIPDFKIIPCREERDKRVATPWIQETYSSSPDLMQGQGFEHVGDKTCVWYSGWIRGMIRLATWQRDRFGYFVASREPTEGQRPGYIYSVSSGDLPFHSHFISCPIQLDKPGRRVFVNADGLSEQGHVTVEILDEQFRKLPHFSGDECQPLTAGGFRQAVTWRNRQQLDHFTDPIRVRVNYGGPQMHDPRIYAVYIA